jgi:hypothetical protein
MRDEDSHDLILGIPASLANAVKVTACPTVTVLGLLSSLSLSALLLSQISPVSG